MTEVASFELSAHSCLDGVRAFGAVGIAEGRSRRAPVGVGGDQSVVGTLDVEDRMEGREVDREVAEPRVVEDTEVRAQGFRYSPGRRVLVELLQARRHGRLGGDDCVVAIVLAAVHRSEGTQPLVRCDLPSANATDVEAAAFAAAVQAPQGTPHEPAGEAEIAVAKRAVALDHLCAEVAPSRAEPQLIPRPGLAQAIVHDTGWRWIRETDGIDADAYAHARQHRIVQRRGTTEVGVIDAIGAAVVQVEAADLALAYRGPTARCRRVRRMRRRQTSTALSCAAAVEATASASAILTMRDIAAV